MMIPSLSPVRVEDLHDSALYALASTPDPHSIGVKLHNAAAPNIDEPALISDHTRALELTDELNWLTLSLPFGSADHLAAAGHLLITRPFVQLPNADAYKTRHFFANFAYISLTMFALRAGTATGSLAYEFTIDALLKDPPNTQALRTVLDVPLDVQLSRPEAMNLG